MPDNLVNTQPATEKILEHISQGVVATDVKGVITYWNKGCERIFGYTQQEMLNQSAADIYPKVAEKQFLKDIQKLREGKEIQGQWKSMTKGGEIKWIDIFAKPLCDECGNPEAFIASIHDIQKLKKVEEELASNKAQAQAILEATVEGIITTDDRGRIKNMNKSASRIFGYSEEEMKGRNIRMLVPMGFQGRYYREQMIGKRRELTGRRKDGSLFPMELSVSELQWHGETILTGVINDISERRRLEKEILNISEEERRNLGQDLHDGLGQMLTGISLISQNLARKLKSNGIPGADEVEEISNLIKEADGYAKALAHGLVHVDFKEEGLQVALNELSNQAEKFFNVNCNFKDNCDFTVNNNLQAMHLYRIAQEAISNAVKHGKANNICIDLTADDEMIKLSIKDDGIGFSESGGGKKKGMGIHIMTYRANMLSGHLDIKQTEDKLTNVECNIPLSK